MLVLFLAFLGYARAESVSPDCATSDALGHSAPTDCNRSAAYTDTCATNACSAYRHGCAPYGDRDAGSTYSNPASANCNRRTAHCNDRATYSDFRSAHRHGCATHAHRSATHRDTSASNGCSRGPYLGSYTGCWRGRSKHRDGYRTRRCGCGRPSRALFPGHPQKGGNLRCRGWLCLQSVQGTLLLEAVTGRPLRVDVGKKDSIALHVGF